MLGISRRILVACVLLTLPALALAVGVASEINGVSVIPAGGKVRVEISKVGDVTFNAFVMSDPDRLVINCVGARYNVPWQTININNPVISRVRTSQFQIEPTCISRVVLDLKKDIDYKTWTEGSMQIVEITERSGSVDAADAAESAALMQPVSAPEVAKAAAPASAEQAEKPVVEAAMGPFLPYLPPLSMNVSAPAAAKKAEPVAETAPVAAPAETPATAPVAVSATAPVAAPVAAPAKLEEQKVVEASVAQAPVSPVASAEVIPSAVAPSEPVKSAAETPAAPAAPEAKSAPSAPVAAAPVKAAEPAVNDTEDDSPWLSDDEDYAAEPAKDSSARSSAYGADRENLTWSKSYARGNPAAGGGAGMGSQRITIDAQGADIKTVLRTVSDYSGKNIVYGPDVKGEVYIHIKDVPWEEALDIILRAHGYGYREEYGMIRVAQMDRLMKEEIDVQGAERKKDELMPLVTRIIFVNNSNAEEIKTALQNIVSSRGKIDVDKGSNALIVNDTEPVIDKIAEMVKSLDRKTFQVGIDAKLVEVDVEATRELGINWGLLNLHASGFSGTGSAEVASNIASSAGTVKFGTVRSWGELSAVLESLEKTNKANIISNPRITTMDNREASILVGKEIPLIVADEAGNPITELTKIGIMLKVTPHVNSDKTITLDMHPEVSELQGESTAQGGVIISTSEADTRVVVSNGNTAVIGGLIKNVQTSERRGVPVLKDIPVLGHLFSSSSKADKKQELVIFVTPTIVE